MMMDSTRMDIDLAKQGFLLPEVDERGHTVLRRRILRTQLRTSFAQLSWGSKRAALCTIEHGL